MRVKGFEFSGSEVKTKDDAETMLALRWRALSVPQRSSQIHHSHVNNLHVAEILTICTYKYNNENFIFVNILTVLYDASRELGTGEGRRRLAEDLRRLDKHTCASVYYM